ncbi:unnamed protein product, partial [Brassica oleracea var. botrytis]
GSWNSVAIFGPGLVTSRSPYGDLGLQRLGRHMVTWAGNIPVGACSVPRPGRHMATRAQAVFLEAE